MVTYFQPPTSKKSNVVGFPVVWETVKEPENVVNYNIRDEQTIDANSVITANNQTTTGMATQIPWINCPKLIASTSIIWDLWWGGAVVSSASADKSMTWGSNTAVNWYTITSDSWDIYLDDDYPARIYSKWWTYLIAIHSRTTNSNATIAWTLYKYTSWWTQSIVLQFSQSGWSSWETTLTTVTTLEDGWHVRLYVTLWITHTYHCEITFVKLA